MNEVLGFSIGNCWNDGILIVWKEDGMSEINIYELAHKCKEFAFKQGYEIQSRIMSNDHQKRGNCCILKVEYEYESCIKIENAKTEPEAIFKACQWILENKDKR